MNFASDNAAGVAPRDPGGDRGGQCRPCARLWAGRGDRAGRPAAFCDIFEREAAVFLMPTGTAANALALAHLSPPVGRGPVPRRVAHHHATNAGRRNSSAAVSSSSAFPARRARSHAETLREALERGAVGRAASRQPSVLSLTQATEAGTVYRPDEIAALAAAAHAQGLAVHMDGARFANALVRLGCTPAEATWKAGVDVLSLGATKAGALAAEAIVFFEPEQRGAIWASGASAAGHLVSKHRFIAAQFEAFFADDLWLELARHANAQADPLAQRLDRGRAARRSGRWRRTKCS